MTAALAPKPAHVPDDLVFDFDFVRDERLSNDIHAGMMSLHREAPDIFWTPRNGGHWMATRMADIQKVMTNPTIFSSVRAAPLPLATLTIPAPPQDMDGREHLRLRLMLMKILSPKYFRAQADNARALINELIDGLEGRSSCEFKEEIASRLPVLIFIRMMGLDETRRQELTKYAQDLVYRADPAVQLRAFNSVSEYLSELVEHRRAHPGQDPVSLLLASELDGEAVSPGLVKDIMNLLFTAGLDTITIMMTYIMKHLAENPDIQRRLRSCPHEIEHAVEELIRLSAFANLPRRLVQDATLSGVEMKAEEHIVCSLVAAGLDARNIENPESIDLDRTKCPHIAFNIGPHLCLGAPLARVEIKVLLEEWLRRMPDVQLASGYVPHSHGGITMSIDRLDLIW